MQNFWLVAMVFVLAANSAGPATLSSAVASNSRGTQNSMNVGQGGVKPPHSNEANGVPAEFSTIDFKNLSYRTTLHGEVLLKDGHYEHRDHNSAGGEQIELRAVSYIDLIGDDRPEAVVHLTHVSCGISCDGGSHSFYFFSGARGTLRSLARLETGSLGYGCGLKAFTVEHRRLRVEVFQQCTTNGSTLRLLRPIEGNFIARSYTRFVFRLRSVGLSPEGRQTVPNSNTDIMNYSPDIRIGN